MLSAAATRNCSWIGFLGLLVGTVGCGEAPGDGSTGYRSGPLYVVSNTLLGTDEPTSYVTVVDSLGVGPSIDLGRSLEFPGSGRAYGPENADVVYVTSSESPTMTEVTFKANGSPKVGRTVSFGNLGIRGTSGGNVLLHLSPTKAYFVSQESQEIVVWNPESMTITKTVPLGLAPDPVFPDVYFYPRPILVGDRLALVSNKAGDLSGPGVTVTIVNTATDQIEGSMVDLRCHSVLQSGVDALGDRYFASSDYAAAEHFLLPDQVPAPCMLRMRAGQMSFDPTWSRTLTRDLDTPLWTGVTQGANGHVYVQATASGTPAVAGASDAYGVTIAQPWNWYRLSDGDTAPSLAETGLLYPPSFAPIPVNQDAYISVFDDVNTTLVNLTSSEIPKAGLIVPGFVYNIVRIR